MARIIVMPDARHLKEGITGTVLYAEQVTPERLDDLACSERILERLEGAVRGEQWRTRANDSLAPALPVERVRSYLRLCD